MCRVRGGEVMDTITLELQPNTRAWSLGVIPNQWHRSNGRIIAAYTSEQLAYALACAGKFKAALRLLVDEQRATQMHREALELRGLA